MAWKQDHKKNSQQRILKSAAKLFTHNGFERVSIDEIMAHAGLTRGAFYTHFKSKSELYAEAMQFGAKQTIGQFSDIFDVQKIVNHYLSENHVRGDKHQCPLAFLVSDINQQEQKIRDSYTKIFNGLAEKMQQSGLNREQALKQCVLMIGGVAISRALSDKSLITELLQCCKET